MEDIKLIPMKKSISTKLPGTFLLTKRALSENSPIRKAKRRKYLSKIIATPQSLDEVKEASEENSPVDPNISKCKFFLNNIIVNSNLYDQDDEEKSGTEQKFKRKLSQDIKESYSNEQFGLKNNSQVDMNMEQDSQIMEDEVQKMFMNQNVSKNSFIRRQSSMSEIMNRKNSIQSKELSQKNNEETPATNSYMVNLLNEDDRDCDEMSQENKQKLMKINSMKEIPRPSESLLC